MKLMINLPKEVVTAIQNGEDYRYDIHTAIAQGIPYEERPTGDLISREALKETVELEEGIFWDSYSSGELIVRKEYIDNAPTVKFSLLPADESKEEAFMRGYEKGKIEGILKAHTRPKGEWILIKNSDGVLKCYECSECKKCQGYISNFCEDCGADMRKGGTE